MKLLLSFMTCTMLLFMSAVSFGSDGAPITKDPISIMSNDVISVDILSTNVEVYSFNCVVPACTYVAVATVTHLDIEDSTSVSGTTYALKPDHVSLMDPGRFISISNIYNVTKGKYTNIVTGTSSDEIFMSHIGKLTNKTNYLENTSATVPSLYKGISSYHKYSIENEWLTNKHLLNFEDLEKPYYTNIGLFFYG